MREATHRTSSRRRGHHDSGSYLRATGNRWSPALINVAGLTILVFLMGGSSRPDVWSLLILRPVAILSLGYGLWSLTRQDIVRHRFLFGMAAAILVIVVAALIPLPPVLWTALGGRSIIIDIDAATGLSGTWRPISMAPELTWNALFSLSVPLAIFVNGIRLTSSEHRTAMLVILGGGALTMIVALGQIVGGGDPALYLYRHSSFGEPSGLFSNRNHEALFLATLLPIAGFLFATRDRRGRKVSPVAFLTGVGVLMVIAFLLVLGSRAGLIAGFIGLLSFAIFAASREHQAGETKRKRWLLGLTGFAGIAIVLVAALTLGNARSVQRFMVDDSREELRYHIWPVIAEAVPQYMPFGTGAGTYERVFRIIEPDTILRPTYSNHAHNDWLEVVFTAGVPGFGLLAMAVLGFFVAAWRTWSARSNKARVMGGAGLVIVFVAAIGSFIDYPLRTPVLSVLFTLSCLWVASGRSIDRIEGGALTGDQDKIRK